MKEPMKKISVLSFYRETKSVIDLLQDLGVVHIVLGDQDPSDYEDLDSQRKRVDRAIEDLKRHTSGAPITRRAHDQKSTEELLTAIEQTRVDLEKYSSQMEVLGKERLRSEPWGTFTPDILQRLNENDVRIRYFEARKKEFLKFDTSDLVCEIIHQSADKVYFTVIEYGSDLSPIPFEEVGAPVPLHQIDAEFKEASRYHDQRLSEVRSFTPYLEDLEDAKRKVEEKIEYIRVSKQFTINGNDKIDLISGWLPTKHEQKVCTVLNEQELGYQIENPSEGDVIPVILKNNAYTRIFETITRVFQLPKYYELDLTPIIAVFYPIFFAYCLGDAGYGVIVLGVSLAGWFTFMKGSRSIAMLGIILGTLTTFMGIIKSGSVFGLPLVDTSDVALFAYLSKYVLIPDDQTVVFNAFNVALMLGVLQIFVGIISSIINKIIYDSVKASLGQFGKLFIVIGVLILFLANMQDVAALQPYSAHGTVLLYVGIGMVLVFHDMSISIVPRVSSGLLPLFFIFTGILGDILSYVRLFALGVASSVLGLVVNQIGMQIMDGSILGAVLGVIFLLFGHTLNLALAILGAFVHPLRLTFVEFYNNAQFQGGGIEYKPFKKLNNELKKE